MKNYVIVLIIVLISEISYAQYDSIPFDGYERTYLLHLPTGYTGTKDLPLVIAMHGGFGSAVNIENQSQLSIKADKEKFIVVYPEGVKSALKIRTWNAGWCCGFASNANIDDVGFIDSLLNTLIGQYSIDTNRIYATGMSNGGFMAHRLACELSNRIAAIAPVAASMSMTSCSPIRSVPVIQFHSYLDNNVPLAGGVGSGPSPHYNPSQDSVMNAWASINSCSVANDTIVDNAQYTFTNWRNCDCETEIHHYLTRDGGHSWPGGKQTIVGDPVSKFINANDLMWSFFQQYSLNCGRITSVKSFLIDKSDFLLFPNPTSGIINIKHSEIIEGYSITVYDRIGNTILMAKNEEVIDLSNQPSGLYFFVLKTKEQSISKKILKVE